MKGRGSQTLISGLRRWVCPTSWVPLPPKVPGNQPRGDWDDWNTVGLRFYAASSGSEAGFDAFDAFSCKNTKKYDAEATRARWEHFRTSPPTRTGVGALVVEARRCDPTFRARRPERPEATREQARDTGDAADWHSLLLSNGKSPLGCEANVEIALRHAPELAGRLRFNELTDTAECSAPP